MKTTTPSAHKETDMRTTTTETVEVHLRRHNYKIYRGRVRRRKDQKTYPTENSDKKFIHRNHPTKNALAYAKYIPAAEILTAKIAATRTPPPP